MKFQLSENLQSQVEPLSQQFKNTGRVRISSFLESKSAKQLASLISEQQYWNLVFHDGSKHVDLSPESQQALNSLQNQQLTTAIYQQANKGFQYLYNAIPIYDIYKENRMPESKLNSVAAFVNSDEFLNFCRSLTNCQNISFADVQATKYSRGHFLKTHDDGIDGKNRVAAFVLSLTKNWKFDQGGLLNFSNDENQEATAYLPQYNSLTVFKVPQPHFVSPVANYCNDHRISLTGWLRTPG